MHTIDIGKLKLEPQLAAHAEEMFAVLSDPAIYQYENEPPVSVQWLRKRFTRLEARQSSDGREQWLNWVIRLPSGELIGFVQATVHPNHQATIACVLTSKFWGRGLARQSVQTMISELTEQYQVRNLFAILKQENYRSLRLLKRIGFSIASNGQYTGSEVKPDELLMHFEPQLP
ncbi:GNAT family N-acetyltransferase [Leptolyngbya sp. FACHB-261]|uniref:GNAT family N-acetyltransferase n=1 Tax=Leptolyngbya sp. FACHB-261 TaxID=2692806 RepID=UPI0016864D8F|nr:GNAT family N-acetyltransferase [Leptolyngbya sp. FACHB-261]MBD2103943.1 GNAT family N-acetyltransferase [Leptolyngbya sp. FACHB-261]